MLGKEGLKVLKKMKEEGISDEILEPLMNEAKKAAGIQSDEKEVRITTVKRCKWWNRGFCRDKESCSFSHPLDDCHDHLNGGCISRGCNTKRHRKQCKYFNTETGCFRGHRCEYLHKVMEVTIERQVEEVLEMGTQTEPEEKCICKKNYDSCKVEIKDDKIICILKRAECSDEEWEEYEEKVESEMSLSDLLEDLGKVIEASVRLSQKNG